MLTRVLYEGDIDEKDDDESGLKMLVLLIRIIMISGATLLIT